MIDLVEGKNEYIAHFARFEHRMSACGFPWLKELRKNALARFAELGFPTTRNEEWRFTNISPIAKTPFKPADPKPNYLTISDISRFTVCEARCTQMVFLNGFYSDTLSTVKFVPKGVQIISLAKAFETHRELLEPVLAESGSNTSAAFRALNSAFMEDGAFVYIPSGTVMKDPVHLLFLSTSQSEPTVSAPRSVILAGNDTRVSIVESYASLDRGVYFTNSVTDLHIGTNSIVDHYKLQRESDDAFHVANVQVVQDRDSSYLAHSLSLGGSLVRNDIRVLLDGPGAECDLNGLYVTKGHQHVDNHTTIDHAKPNCVSRELYKGILDDNSSGVFNGKIVVRKDAQKTNARQTNKNLLLSKGAGVNTTPQLEIFADDVKCTHGATIGQLNEEELFYLRSRGIEKSAAKILLTYAFASELLGAIKIKPIQCQIDLVLLNRLSRG